MTDRDASTSVEIVDADLDGVRSRILWQDGVVVAVEPSATASPARRTGGGHRADIVTVDADGGAVIPGLWDHHLHLAAMTAAVESLAVDPAGTPDARTFAARLRGAATDVFGWVRAVGYHESIAGDLDARMLDALLGDRRHIPVRVQHRSGQMWILNSAGLEASGTRATERRGYEVGTDGRPTGRVFGDVVFDDAMNEPGMPGKDRAMSGSARIPDEEFIVRMAGVLDRFAADGVTGVTDMTPTSSPRDIEVLREATARSGAVRLGWSGAVDLSVTGSVGDRVAVKFLPPDHLDPDVDALIRGFRAAHEAGVPVAVHCVTRVGVFAAIAAWREVGSMTGDRIEHGAVLPPEALTHLAELGVTVVTQPNFVAERGDRYLADVEPDDLGHLWRCGSLPVAGVPVAAGTDAPFGSRDPWAAMRAAVDRRTHGGALLGAHEAVSPRSALALFLGRPDSPSMTRGIRPGERTDLCVLGVPLADALDVLDRSVVRGTVGASGFREVRPPG